jgi:ABC-type glycerol-3-phosphate transport system permease component
MLDFMKVLGIVGLSVMSVFLVSFLIYGDVNMTDFYTGLAILLISLVAGLGYWTFKQEFDKLYKNGIEKTKYTSNEIQSTQATLYKKKLKNQN